MLSYLLVIFKIIELTNELAVSINEGDYEKMIASGMSEKDAKKAADKKANEDARFVLPNACDTRMIVTMNTRSLYNFFSLRCCDRAQMLLLCKQAAPLLFKQAGPPCVRGKCSEGSYSCGKAAEMKKIYG